MSTSVHSLAALLKQSDIEDHEQVLTAAESALKQNKSDLDAQHVRIVALLKLDRYNDAVQATEAGGAKLKDRARLEYAYALYKSGKPDEAAKVAEEGEEEGGRGYKHVEAQSRYRLEDFKRAAELYRELAAGGEEDADLDLRINSGATNAQLEWASQGYPGQQRKPGREDLEAFETAFNAACQCIARGELAQGEVLLKRARDLCGALEDMSEEDKMAEMLPIMVQQVYVLAKLGKTDEAETLSRNIDVEGIADPTTQHIARVNSVASSASTTNPFLAQRLMAAHANTSKADHPFAFQSTILGQNRYAVDLQSLKYAGTVESTSSAASKLTLPSLDAYCNTLSVVNAAAHARSATGKEALKQILPLLEKRPDDVGLLLTIIQLYVLTGNSASAISLFESFLHRLEQSNNAADLDVRFAPGLVGALISLYHRERRKGHIQRELTKAATHWRRKSKSWPAGVVNLLKAAGASLIESTDPESQKLAEEIFVDLHSQDADDRYAAAGLLATAQDPKATASQRASLTPIDRLIANLDASALENAGIARPSSSAAQVVMARKRPAEDGKKGGAAKKKIRKSRIPKDYDPAKTPDPERWLPLRDRSTYRPKGKKGKARANLLSQGAAPAGESDGSRPGTPGGEVVKAKQQQGGGGGGGGKKKNKKR